MGIFREFKLSLPYERVIFTKQERPNLASQAPKDKIRSGSRFSVCADMDIVIDIMVRSPRDIASRFNKHRRKLFCVIASAIVGVIIIRGRRVCIIGVLFATWDINCWYVSFIYGVIYWMYLTMILWLSSVR